jgi:hypothetical protein
VSESDDRTRWLQRRVQADVTDVAAVSALAQEYARAGRVPGPHEHCWHEYALPAEIAASVIAQFCCGPGCRVARVIHPLAAEADRSLKLYRIHDLPPHEVVVVQSPAPSTSDPIGMYDLFQRGMELARAMMGPSVAESIMEAARDPHVTFDEIDAFRGGPPPPWPTPASAPGAPGPAGPPP